MNDIGKQFNDTAFGEAVTLVALDTWEGVQMALVFNPNTPNPSNIPGLNEYWVRVSTLTPVEGN